MATSGTRYRWNSKNRKVRINPARSAAMKVVTRHLKGRKRPKAIVDKIKRALKLTYRTKRTVSGRRLQSRKKKS